MKNSAFICYVDEQCEAHKVCVEKQSWISFPIFNDLSVISNSFSFAQNGFSLSIDKVGNNLIFSCHSGDCGWEIGSSVTKNIGGQIEIYGRNYFIKDNDRGFFLEIEFPNLELINEHSEFERYCLEPKELGKICQDDNDCQSNHCIDYDGDGYKNCFAKNLDAHEKCYGNEQCQTNSCIQNPSDRGRICYSGVGSVPEGEECIEDSECQSNLCRITVNSGTTICLPSNLGAGDSCDLDIQCQSFNCDNRVCSNQPRTNLPDGSLCNIDEDCQSGACITHPQLGSRCGDSNLDNGEECRMYTQCQSGYCEPVPGLFTRCNACTVDSQCQTGMSCLNGVCS